MKKRTIVAGIALLLLAGGRLPAQENAAERVEAIKAEYQQARTEFFQRFREAKTDEEKQEAAKTSPSADRYKDELLDIARAAGSGEAGMDALVWLVQNIRSPEIQEDALILVLEHHVSSPNAGTLCGSLLYSTAPSTERVLERILEANEHDEARGIACYTLAQRLQSEKMFERVVADFGDVAYRRGTLGDAARGDLNELRNLAIGKVAPEIQGEDIDGVQFKLSDYRGKVVVLDFWGNW